MPDPISTAVSALNAGKLLVQGSKAAFDLVQGVRDAELKTALLAKITELQTQACEASRVILEQQQTIQKLKEDLVAARKKEALIGAIEWKEEAAWLKEPGTRPDGPYCPRCAEDGELRLALASKGNAVHQYRWHCHTCETKFGPGAPPDLSGFGPIRA